jgi:hypothetical protein
MQRVMPTVSKVTPLRAVSCDAEIETFLEEDGTDRRDARSQLPARRRQVSDANLPRAVEEAPARGRVRRGATLELPPIDHHRAPWAAVNERGETNRGRGGNVPGAGIEPARPCGQGILSPLRLPVSPPRPVSAVGSLRCPSCPSRLAKSTEGPAVKSGRPLLRASRRRRLGLARGGAHSPGAHCPARRARPRRCHPR